MTARYNGRCKDCGARLEAGDTIRYSKATGALCADANDCNDYLDYRAESEAEQRMERFATSLAVGQSREDYYRDEDFLRSRRDEAEYQRGYNEVRQIQLSTTAGSAMREAMYLEMERAAFNRGEDY